jgi:hypothetical protein
MVCQLWRGAAAGRAVNSAAAAGDGRGRAQEGGEILGFPQDESARAAEMFEDRYLRQYENNSGRCPPHIILVDFLPGHPAPLNNATDRVLEDLNLDELWSPVRCKSIHARPIDGQ